MHKISIPVCWLLSVAAAASSVSVVFRADTTSGLTLLVNSDDTYSLGPASSTQPWIQSAGTGFHSNGTWYIVNAPPPAPPGGGCADRLADTDCRGDDISYFTSNDPLVCCAKCQATPGCLAWTLTGSTDEAAADAAANNGNGSTNAPPPFWADRCYLKRNCAGKAKYVGHTSGVLSPSQPVALARVGGFAASGKDPALGLWKGWTLSYTGVGGTVPFLCTFKHFTVGDAIVFEHSFPQGVSNLNITNAAGLNASAHDDASHEASASRVSGPEFSAATASSTAFPSWEAADASAAANLSSRGWLSWNGRFFTQVGSQYGGVAAALSHGFAGALGGPVLSSLTRR